MQSYQIEHLPESLPVFPLAGALLLPSGKLPLNIFEPRYLSMVRDALKTNWLIGMIQPKSTSGGEGDHLYEVGCAGKVVSLAETEDARLLITLSGIIRFKTKQELPLRNGYRQFQIGWEPFQTDLQPASEGAIDREKFERVLRQYLESKNIPAKWEEITKTSSSSLLTSLAMQCPFTVEEKQALLEAQNLAELTNLMTSLLTMAADSNATSSTSHH
tara:strand:+ start:1081 stop:1728 length:648 start_codon:yes stop_codon:yes gene_type:complete